MSLMCAGLPWLPGEPPAMQSLVIADVTDFYQQQSIVGSTLGAPSRSTTIRQHHETITS